VWIHARGKPAYVAKNRYGIPDKVRFVKGAGYSALAPYLPGGAPATAAAAE